MQTPADYRTEAEMYIRQAEAAATEARRERFFEMAQACLRLAGLAELLSIEPAVPAHSAPTPNGYSSQLYSGL